MGKKNHAPRAPARPSDAPVYFVRRKGRTKFVLLQSAGSQVRLTETDGIDILGNLIEASILSRNPNLYGSLHNNGHNAIAYIHDPDHRFLVKTVPAFPRSRRPANVLNDDVSVFQENYGVMGDSSTAMRDPVFYRWHAYIDDIFQEFKATISRYTVQNVIRT